MKKLILFTLTVICFCSLSGLAQDLTLDDVLSKYYEATGVNHVKEWNTLIMTGKSVAQGMEFPVTIYMKRPGKIRTEVEIQGNKMLQVLDGDQGWAVAPWSGSTDPQDMTADVVKAMKEQADFEGSLYNWKEKGHKAELIGKEDMEGTSVYKIKVTLVDGNIETYFMDAENFVPLKIASVTKIQGNDTESETFPSNYKEVNGAVLPFAIENKFKGQTVSNVLIEKYEINKEVSDSLFVKPAKKQ
jgi:outer membrane lipoprotein-sorting protein